MPRIILLFILLFSFFAVAAYTEDLPRPSGYVNDFAGVIKAQDKAKLEEMLKSLEKKNGAEVAVVTVKTVGQRFTPKQYATALLNKWGVGKKGIDNGVIFLLAAEDKRVEIEPGYGVEGILTDGQCGRILDEYVVPYLKKGDYSSGVVAGAAAIVSILAPVDFAALPPRAAFPILLIIISILIMAGIISLAFYWFMASRKCPKCGARLNIDEDVLQAATAQNVGKEKITKTCRKCGYNNVSYREIPRITERGFYGGGFGGGGGGSSFGGFGGGRSGGGGSGRSW